MATPDPTQTAPSPQASLTGNGPQAIDDQAAKLRQLLDGAKQGMPATAGAPA